MTAAPTKLPLSTRLDILPTDHLVTAANAVTTHHPLPDEFTEWARESLAWLGGLGDVEEGEL